MKKEPCDLGRVLLAALKVKSINQSELARRCAVSRQHISHLIYGEDNPSLFTLYKISRILNVDLNDLCNAFFGAEAWESN